MDMISLLILAAFGLFLDAMMRQAGCIGRTYVLQEVGRDLPLK